MYLVYVRVKRFFLVPYWLTRAALFNPKSKSAMIDAENYWIGRENPLNDYQPIPEPEAKKSPT